MDPRLPVRNKNKWPAHSCHIHENHQVSGKKAKTSTREKEVFYLL